MTARDAAHCAFVDGYRDGFAVGRTRRDFPTTLERDAYARGRTLGAHRRTNLPTPAPSEGCAADGAGAPVAAAEAR